MNLQFLNGTTPASKVPIVFMDYEGKSDSEMLEILKELRDLMINSDPDQMFKTISNFTNCKTFSEFVKKSQDYAEEIFNKKTIKTTAYGFNGITKLCVHGYNTFIYDRAKKLVPTKTKEEGLNYLIKD